MTPALTDEEQMRRLLPLLTEFFERERVLLVIDNAESFLTARGTWRDERGRLLFEALTSHTGLSRVVLTSRVRPASANEQVAVEPVHALALREAVLLARELPHLGPLIDGTVPGVEAGAGRQVVSEVLAAVDGHPELLVLADAQAADPARLDALLETARHIWEAGGKRSDDAGAEPRQAQSAEDYAAVLHSWTRGIAEQFTEDERILFHTLSRMEESDRGQKLVTHVWTALGQVRPASSGAGPAATEAPVPALVRSGLVVQTAADGGQLRWDLHPSVAGTGRAAADEPLASAVDSILADHWCDVLEEALAHEDTGRTGTAVLGAGRAACPYLLRLRDWERMADVVSRVLVRDLTRPTALALLPFLEEAATHAGDADRELRLARTHARALLRVDPEAGERRLTELFDLAVLIKDHARAANLASDLRARHRNTGRLADALMWAERAVEHSALSGQGPWTLLGIEAARVQLLSFAGRSEEALEQARILLERSGSLSRDLDPSEGLEPWTVEEMLLDISRVASRDLGQWTDALEFNRRIAACEQRRGAPVLEQTHTLFNTGELLLSLGRLDESADTFQSCRQEYERQLYEPGLAWTFTAFAQVEHRRGHGETAVELAGDALRYAYLAGLAADIAVAHHDMGTLLFAYGDEPSTALAHHLAAALIRSTAGLAWSDESLASAAEDASGDRPVRWPATVDELADQVGRVPGADLRRVLGTTTGGEGAAQAWDSLLARARAWPDGG